MEIKQQKKVNLINFILVNVLLGILSGGAFFGYCFQDRANDLTFHSSIVQNQIKELENVTQTALALRQANSFDGESDFLSERRKVYEKIEALQNLVSDNQKQIENFSRLRAAVAGRFSIQDKIFAAGNITGGKLVIEDADRQISNAAQNELNNSFYQIKNLEMILLFERLNDLAFSQKALVFFASSLLAILFLINFLDFRTTKNSLNKIESKTKFLRQGIIEATSSGNQKILMDLSEIDEMLTLIEQGANSHKWNNKL